MTASPAPAVGVNIPLRDPLADVLVGKWKFTVLKTAMLGLAIELGVKGLQVWHGLTIAKHHPALWTFIYWGDWDSFVASLVNSVLIGPAVWGVYAWMVTAPSALLSELDSAHLFPTPLQGVATRAVESRARVIRSWTWLLIALLFPLVCTALWVTQFGPDYGMYLGVQLISWTIGWYMVGMIILRELILIMVLRSYFATPGLQLRALHPDRCGGLGALNRYAMRFTYLIAIAALGLVFLTFVSIDQQRFASEYTLEFGIVLYLVLAPYCFFASLGSAHEAMRQAKEQLLRRIADQFLVDYQSAQDALSAPPQELKSRIEKVTQLRAIYRTTQRFPIWPFDWSHIRRFATAVLAPLGGFIVPQLPNVVDTIHAWLTGAQ